jgi:hypothetical protein
MPPRPWWLDPEEADVERSIFEAMHAGDPEVLESRTVHPWAVYDILESLFVAFDRVDIGQAITRADVERAQTAAKRLRSLVKGLDDPKLHLIGGGKPMHEFLADCRAQATKFSRWARALESRSVNDGDQSLPDFIKGPLAGTYDHLFYREAGGNENGPFARFGACFFEMVGYPVAPATIARALKERPRTKKKRRHPRLVHRAA